MIKISNGEIIAFQYTLSDIHKRIVLATQYASRAMARDRKTPDFPNPIEYGAIDEDDRAIAEDLIRGGMLRVFEVLTFLTNDLVEPLKWANASATSESSVTLMINHHRHMASTLPELVNDRIMAVIVDYALREWYKLNKIIDMAQLFNGEYDNARIDLRTASRLQSKPSSRRVPRLI